MTQVTYSFRALVYEGETSFFTAISVTGHFDSDEDARQSARIDLEKLYPAHEISVIDLLSIER